MFSKVDRYPGDPILTLVETFQADPRPHKVNLGIGLYYDADGRIPLLDLVRRTEVGIAAEGRRRSYLPMEGHGPYREAARRLIFGVDSQAVRDGRIATIQTLGGSGALKVGADFLKRYFPDSGVWVSDPTWDNHRSIFEGAGFKVVDYPYYDANSGAVRFGELLETVASLPINSIVLLHPCCHNPTGVDLSRAQWEALIPLMLHKKIVPFFDIAYQGFGDDIDSDAWPIRVLAETGAPFLVASSFSKNMAIYGERCGSLSVVCQDADQAERVFGQLKYAVRRNYSSPPSHGALVVSSILADIACYQEWSAEVSKMRERIRTMRSMLFETISEQIPDRDFSYLVSQRGMFSYTGLTGQQVDALREHHGVYLVGSGRICIAGLNNGNVGHVASSFVSVLHCCNAE